MDNNILLLIGIIISNLIFLWVGIRIGKVKQQIIDLKEKRAVPTITHPIGDLPPFTTYGTVSLKESFKKIKPIKKGIKNGH